jgi:methionyl aminopeptidase
MVQIKSESEIGRMRAAAELVGRALGTVAVYVKPGVPTADLDRVAEDYIRSHGARPAFKGYRVGQLEYPSTLCISVNDQVVHGIPGEHRLAEGDLVSIDCGVVLDGFYGDSAFTFAVGRIDDEAQDLCITTYRALEAGITQAISGHRVGDISHAVQSYCEQRGYGVVRDLVGHGIGRELHEDPQVPNVGRRGTGRKLKEGLVLCIEPMINMGGPEVVTDGDGWTVRTADSRPSAHYEHMVVVRRGEPEVLTTFAYIEEVITPPYKTEQELQHG